MININFKEIREELDNIKEVNKTVDNFQKFSDLHDKKFLKQVYPRDIPLNATIINSHLKEKSEISERLRDMFYNLSVLRSSILTKDKEKTLKMINNFLKNDYSGVSAITSELNDFKEKINSLENHYNLLMNYMPKTLDNKIITEAKCIEHINKLHSIHKKQKELFVNIAGLFVKLSKTSLTNLRKNK